ncbi:MAG: carboxypeptidase regulatory-like domain-containing protein, partial [Verrucomicrobia bacterium]|nr:carboxypeptidase regulatory-like domain-containing protein [Verrucomicrobiota bacterium]
MNFDKASLMKTFQKFPLLAGLTLALSLRAATNEVQNFSGVVVDGGGNPVAGATVTFVTYPQRMGFQRAGLERKQRATTGAQGGFEFPKFRGEGVVVATKAGFAPGWQSWYAGPGGTVKIILGAPSVLAGAVVDDGGRPVPGAGVWVASALNKVSTDFGQPNFLFGEMAREEFSARTAADGKFRIENFPAGGQALLSVKRAGFALRPMANPASYGELPFHDGQEDIVLTLDPAGTVTGKVVERATGQPLGSACLGLLPAAPGTAIFSSDSGMNRSAADGTFQISDVAAGSYQIEAYWTNEPVPEWIAEPVAITVGAGETVSDVRLEADKGGIVEVTVRGKANEELIAQATISAFSQAFRGGFNPSGMTGGNGVGYLRLPAGQYSVAAQKQDWCPAQESVTVAEGQTNRVTFHLAAAFKVGGIVRDGSGTPVEGASVGVVPYYGGFGSSARTDANGHYELSWEKPAWNGGFQQGFYLLVREAKRKLAAIKEIDETTTNLDV